MSGRNLPILQRIPLSQYNTYICRVCTTLRLSFFVLSRFTSAKLELHAFLRTRTIPYRKKQKIKRAIDREEGGVINYEV